MLKREKLPVCLILLLAGSALLACQPKTVKSEELNDSNKPVIQTTPTPPINTEPITIIAVGDIMLGSTSINDTFLPPNDGANMLKEVTPLLSKADIAFGNLEGPIIDGGISEKCPPLKPVPEGQPAPRVTCFAFRVPTRYGKYLKEAGFDVLSLANNHASDFGEAGRISTRKVLDGLGIKHAGSDRAQFATTILDVKGRKIGFIAFAHNNIVPNVNDLAAARTLVANLKKKVNLVVVSFHGGAEGSNAQNVPPGTEIFVGEQRGNLRAFTKTVIDAGADLVLGHGPHVLRGMEIYKDRLIVYSMGNFATYGMFNLKGAQGLTGLFEIKIGADGKFIDGRIHSGAQIGRGIPTLDKSGAAVKIVRSLSQIDFGANAPKINDDGTVTLK